MASRAPRPHSRAIGREPPAAAPRRGDHASLWALTRGPATWAVHFLACYVTAAVWCAKAATPGAPLGGVRIALGALTIAALLLIGWFGWRGWRQHRLGAATLPHDAPTAGDRDRFLGFAAMLLCALGFAAVLYSAAVIAIIGTCR